MSFAADLGRWYDRAFRDLPWRRTRDPYTVLVSEIMLQQTRVQTVLPYYARFIELFPTAEALARAPEPELLAAWSGLGYYSRARNLQRAAARVVEQGTFPSDYAGLRDLPGIGDYTAAAVASICFDLPYAAVDGNVLRVTARLTADAGDIMARATRERLRSAASSLLDRRNPGRFNQGMMELGATVCLPRNPQCLLCPVSRHCRALAEGSQHELPVKRARRQPVRIDETLLVVERRGNLLLHQRDNSESRLAGFWELPIAGELPGAVIVETVGEFHHSITHHQYRFTVARANVGRKPHRFQWITADQLEALPLSTTARKALQTCKSSPRKSKISQIPPAR